MSNLLFLALKLLAVLIYIGKLSKGGKSSKGGNSSKGSSFYDKLARKHNNDQ